MGNARSALMDDAGEDGGPYLSTVLGGADHHGAGSGTQVVADDVPLLALLRDGRLDQRECNALRRTGLITAGDVRALGLDGVARVRSIGPDALISIARAIFDGSSVPVVRDLAGDVERQADPESDRRPPTWAAPNERTRRLETLAEAAVALAGALSPAELTVIRLRMLGETAAAIGARVGAPREALRHVQARAEGRIADLAMAVEPLLQHWRVLLEAAPAVFERELLDEDHRGGDDDLVVTCRALIRVLMPDTVSVETPDGTERLIALGAPKVEQLRAALQEVAQLGPYFDEELDEALEMFGIPPTLGRHYLRAFRDHLDWSEAVRGWVRRSGPTRDACALVLTRAGNPLSVELLASVVGEPERNVSAQLDRDERFRRVPVRRLWALTAWGDLGEGTRYRTTREAMIDVLTQQGPLRVSLLIEEVRRRHPVSGSAVRMELENEVFGHLPDGRVGMAFQGGTVHEDREPRRSPLVDPPDGSRVTFHQAVTADVLRGSGLTVPKYVAWFAGLRRVPRDRTFEDAEGRQLTIRRMQLTAGVSSLRGWATSLGLELGCLLTVWIDTVDGTCGVRAGCPCHAVVA
jgi:hypothetical protein